MSSDALSSSIPNHEDATLEVVVVEEPATTATSPSFKWHKSWVRQKIADNLRFKQGMQQVRHAHSIKQGETLQSDWNATLLWNPLQVKEEIDCDSRSDRTHLSMPGDMEREDTTAVAACSREKRHRSSSQSPTECTVDSATDGEWYSDSDMSVPTNITVDIQEEPCNDLKTCPRILSPHMARQIHDYLPESLQMQTWERCFAIGRDGDSFITLLECCRPYRSTILVVHTTEGHVLGGFVNTRWSSAQKLSYYGTGQSFLFAQQPHAEPPLPEDALYIYPWTGVNDYCQICDIDQHQLAMGGGGDFGLLIRDCFQRGQTGPCKTFGNPPLIPHSDGLFEIAALEIYGIVPLMHSFPSSVRLSSASFAPVMSWRERSSIQSPEQGR
jgi:hypothetical protein